MVDPEPESAPVMLPVTVPIVQVKVLGMDAVKAMLGAEPLQIVAVGAVSMDGAGLTVTVIV
jgi:hypothetical protein